MSEVTQLDEIIALLRKKQFSSSSEKTSIKDATQLELFNESETEFIEQVKRVVKKDKRGWHKLNDIEQWRLVKGS